MFANGTKARVGKIIITSDLMRESYGDVARLIFGQLGACPVKAELMVDMDAVQYLCLSEAFDELEFGSAPVPVYGIQIKQEVTKEGFDKTVMVYKVGVDKAITTDIDQTAFKQEKEAVLRTLMHSNRRKIKI